MDLKVHLMMIPTVPETRMITLALYLVTNSSPLLKCGLQAGGLIISRSLSQGHF